ncbi:hypothetical protein LOZ80_39040 [Paenibacillus sp. HWE-109]|uniref:hypothetical protein n=1 Tax=Paenibacillus sp. HWE-109 TaxID=1306526 RepID=UPI001EDD50AD|nr:hypothetical protein [Paenibacillus sp. HWE-109]UKS27363.1 hypothetical protein LOZ80_39040 [Paenibacillus sp. HWE-109]
MQYVLVILRENYQEWADIILTDDKRAILFEWSYLYMDFGWRITKYNPDHRNDRGNYSKDEWTSISDIGSTYDNKPLTIEKYKETEDLYVRAILTFVEFLNIPYLQVKELWMQDANDYEQRSNNSKYQSIYSRELVDAFSTITEGELLQKDSIVQTTRLILRENIWCKYQYQALMYVHFGYDYYMYIGSSQPCSGLIQGIVASGLFVEPFESPYLDNEDDE